LWRNGPFPRRTKNTDRDLKDGATQRVLRLRLDERNFRIPDFNRRFSRPAGLPSKRGYTAFSRKKRQRPVRGPMSGGSPLRRPLGRRRRSPGGRTFSDMSCAKAPSWNRRHSQGDHPRRRRHLDRIRFRAASLTVVFEMPLSDVTVVDGEKAVLDCHDHSFVPRTLCDKPSAPRGPLELSDVTRSSVKLSWLAPTSNGGAEIVAYVFERPEHLSPTRTRVARVRPQTDANLAERTRSTTTSASASKTSRSARPTAVRSFSRRRLTVTVTIRIRPVQSHNLFAPCLQ